MSELVIFEGYGQVLIEVATALSPLFIIFLFFQFLFLKLPQQNVIQIASGMVLAFIGLSLFLHGVQIGFFPTGGSLGEQLGTMGNSLLTILFGVIIGFVATFAEPQVRVLNIQVEKVSGGYVPQKVMLYTLSIGVGVAIGLAMVRVIYGIPLLYFLLPGYILALLLTRYSSSTFVSVSFDSGSVATGPMTATFILALMVGVATGIEGRDPLVEGFGMIALATLAPILAVLTLGIIYGGRNNDDEVES